jgi:exportin-1
VLSKARQVIISRFAKPEEVLITEDENGEVVREYVKDTEGTALYKLMRETLVYLTHLDSVDTQEIMLSKLRSQVDGTGWSRHTLNSLSWAVGSISGSMHEDAEKRFVVTVIRDLLGLVEQKRGKDNKAAIAGNIMYVVGQYPRFLRAHWKFLKTVVNKLFEFMHEQHPGVQDMAVDTFLKIAIKTKRKFVVTNAGESRPFVDEILDSLTSVICDLEPQQQCTFYSAMGHVVSAQPDLTARDALIARLMALPN